MFLTHTQKKMVRLRELAPRDSVGEWRFHIKSRSRALRARSRGELTPLVLWAKRSRSAASSKHHPPLPPYPSPICAHRQQNRMDPRSLEGKQLRACESIPFHAKRCQPHSMLNGQLREMAGSDWSNGHFTCQSHFTCPGLACKSYDPLSG